MVLEPTAKYCTMTVETKTRTLSNKSSKLGKLNAHLRSSGSDRSPPPKPPGFPAELILAPGLCPHKPGEGANDHGVPPVLPRPHPALPDSSGRPQPLHPGWASACKRQASGGDSELALEQVLATFMLKQEKIYVLIQKGCLLSRPR